MHSFPGFCSTRKLYFHKARTDIAAHSAIIIGTLPLRLAFQAFSTSTTTPSRRARLYGHIYSREAINSSGNNSFMTHLVCGVQDRLILYAFDTQHDLETIPRTIRGLSQDDIRVYHSPLADFFLALLPRSC